MKKIYIGLATLIMTTLHCNQYHTYFWANYKQFEGDKSNAHKWYETIFEKPHSLLTNKGYIHFLSENKNYRKILELMPKVEKAFTKDPDIQLIFVAALKHMGKKDEADRRLIELSQKFKLHPEIVFNAAETLVQRKELQNALDLIDNYLNNTARKPNNFVFYFIKGQIYLQMRDFKQARAHLEQCLDAHPKFHQGYLLKAMIEEESGQIDNAIKGYASYLQLVGPNKQIERHLLELALKNKNATNNTIVVVNRSCFQKAYQFFQRKNYTAALTQINSCLQENQDDVQARLLKVQLHTILKQHNEVIATLMAWIVQDPGNHIWLQTLHLLPRTGTPIEKVISALSALHQKFPEHTAIPLYLADLYTRTDNTERAIELHMHSANRITDKTLKKRILFQIAALQYEQEKYDAMIETLTKIESDQDPFAPALNLHAYYCATHGHDLEKAEQFFKKAYEIDKGNPHFLDTKAVILYKKKEYAKALKLLEPLAHTLSHDSSIHIHLAKTYHKLGYVDKARKAIDQAKLYAHTQYEKKIAAILSYQWNKHATTS